MRDLRGRSSIAVATIALLMVATTAWAAGIPRVAPTDRGVAALPIELADAARMLRDFRGEVADAFVSRAFASPPYRQMEDLIAQRDDLALKPGAAHAMTTGGLVGVLVPVAGGAGSSMVQLWFDRESGDLVQSFGYLFSLSSDGAVAASLVVDGLTRLEALLDPAGKLLAATAIDELGVETALDASALETKDFACFNQCLASFGIAAWILIFVGIACGFLCGATLGLGCLACLVGTGLIAGYELGVCWERCT